MNWILHPIASYKTWRDRKYMKRMIREAKRMHEMTGKRYHVVPIDDGKLDIVCNDQMKIYNRMNKKANVNGINLVEMSIYSTPVNGLYFRMKKLKI